MTHKSKTALYPGSFNPFTTGHKSIVERTLKFCDRVVIAIGHNPDKNMEEAARNLEKIKAVFAGEARVEAVVYEGLTVDVARECGADVIVRGVRGVSDYDYELKLAEVNLRLSGIETIFLPALPELAFVSSSMVRELQSYGHDVSQFLPD